MRKRMHPLFIFNAMFQVIRDNIFIIFLLFILNFRNDGWIFKYGRWAFFLFLLGTLIYLIAAWFVTTYEFKDQTAHMYRGVFKKKHSSVPLYRVQNIQRKTPFYFKWFSATTLSLETGIQEDGAAMSFDAISLEEAERIEQLLDDYRKEEREVEESELDGGTQLSGLDLEEERPKRRIHFTPTRKEVLKASFLSFSFLAIIPLALTAFFKLEEIMDIEEQMTGIVATITKSWLSVTVTVIAILFLAIITGIIYAYLRYGKYEVASDDTRIYIRSGILTEKSFSIRKERVQAVQINEPFFKKMLGLAEVRLISASTGIGETADVSSLYPFLPVKRAHSILEEILPDFELLDGMERLPKRSLKVKMLRIPWTLIGAIGILFFIGWKYWWSLPILTAIIYLRRYFIYRNTRYKMESGFIQFKVGGLSSSTFITTRKLVTEIFANQSFLQRKFNLISISTINRTALLHVETLDDIPEEVGDQFINWYVNRLEEIEIEQSSH